MSLFFPATDCLKDVRRWSPVEYYLVFVAMALPWQDHQIIRKGITLFHVVNGFLVVGMLFSFLLRGPKPRWYLAIPLFIYMFGSILGMFSSDVLSINIYTIMQDFYLYWWFVALCVLFDSEKRVDLLVLAWVMALILVLGTEGFVAHGGGAMRGEFSFRNPNRAAAYLSLSLYLLLHPSIPWVPKGLLGALVIRGITATGSAAGSLGIILGLSTFLSAIVYAKSPKVYRPILLMGLIVMGLAIAILNPLSNRDLPSLLGEMAPSASSRIERSADTREQIWAKGLESFREHPLGIGPASFHLQIDSGVSDDGSIELHSDFVASLVERGIFGLFGFLLLIGVVIYQVFRMLHMSLSWRDIVWSAALAGATASYLFYCITHEALHHETFWLLLALVISRVQLLQQAVGHTSALPTRASQQYAFEASRTV